MIARTRSPAGPEVSGMSPSAGGIVRRGPAVVAVAAASIAGLIGYALRGGVGEDALAQAIRITARSSLTLFLLAFSASSLLALWPSRLTRWLRLHRRYLGISFALSHLAHAATILWQASFTAGRSMEGRTFDTVGGGIVYLFIVAMLATSFDRTAAWVGPRVWRWIHTPGAWLIWGLFTLGVLLRLGESRIYAAPASLLLLAAGLRMARRVRR